MFGTIEDLVENSVNLNYKVYPMLKGMLAVVEKSENPEYIEFQENLAEVVAELEKFLSIIEASADDEEGGLNLDDFENRKFH